MVAVLGWGSKGCYTFHYLLKTKSEQRSRPLRFHSKVMRSGDREDLTKRSNSLVRCDSSIALRRSLSKKTGGLALLPLIGT